MDDQRDSYDEYGVYITGEWKHPISMDEYCDLFVLLYSGLFKNNDYSCKVNEDGNSLSLHVCIPEAIATIDTLQKVAMSNDPGIKDLMHPCMCSIADKLKDNKKSMTDDWWKHFTLLVPFVVEQRVVFIKCSKGAATGTVILHIRTQRVRDSYCNKVRDDSEEITTVNF